MEDSLYTGTSCTIVDISRKKIRNIVISERKACGESLDEAIIDKLTDCRLREEVKKRNSDNPVPAYHTHDM